MTDPTELAVAIRPRKIDMQAMLVTADNLHQVAAWAGARAEGEDIGRPEVAILRADGDTYDWAAPGDYVIKGSTGRFFPLEEWLFVRDYEVIDG